MYVYGEEEARVARGMQAEILTNLDPLFQLSSQRIPTAIFPPPNPLPPSLSLDDRGHRNWTCLESVPPSPLTLQLIYEW